MPSNLQFVIFSIHYPYNGERILIELPLTLCCLKSKQGNATNLKKKKYLLMTKLLDAYDTYKVKFSINIHLLNC